MVLSGVAVILVLGGGFGLIRSISEPVEVAASASQPAVATSAPAVAANEPVSPSRSRTSPSPRKSTAQSASRPAAPKRTATPRPPDLSAADLDPCSGGAYPFEYALGASSSPPPAGSDERQAVANVQAILADLGYQGRSPDGSDRGGRLVRDPHRVRGPDLPAGPRYRSRGNGVPAHVGGAGRVLLRLVV